MNNEEIVFKIQQGGYSSKRLYEQLYQQNIPLIQKIINPFEFYIEHDDLMQEAYIGLYNAVEHYESDKEVKFMSFASYWIIKAIQDYMLISGAVRVPSHIRERVPRYNKAVAELSQQLDRSPTNEEIAKYMKVKPLTVLGIQNYLNGAVSLDKPITEDEHFTLQDTLQADCDVESQVCEDLYKDYEKEQLWTIVDDFTSNKESQVLRLLFINGLTYREIGECLNVSKQRIEQVKRKAITNLRTGRAKRKLIEKLEVVDSGLYKGSFNQYKLREHTSVVEHIALKDIEIKEGLTLTKVS